MKPPVHVVRGGPAESRARPGRLEAEVVLVTALGAGPMTGGEGDGLVEEEELGVRAGAHHHTPPPAEAGEARDPASPLSVANDATVGVV